VEEGGVVEVVVNCDVEEEEGEPVVVTDDDVWIVEELVEVGPEVVV
jgi:hypothetical protein